MSDDVLGHLREARAILADETRAGKGTRETSLSITKIDEAILWRQEHSRITEPPINQTASQEWSKEPPMMGMGY